MKEHKGLRFLLFSAQYLPTVGGVERFTASLARQLAAMGHAPTVVTSALPGLPPQEKTAGGVRVVRLPAWLLLKGRFPVPRKNRAFKRLAAALWAEEYDFALVNARFYLLSLWAARQCRRRGIPAVVLEHGTAHLSLGNRLVDFFGNAYEHLLFHLVRKNCGRFYGVSKASAEWLSHFGAAAEGVLYNAVDMKELLELAAAPKRDFRNEIALPHAAPLIVFSGRFIAEKGIRELLDAFALLRQTLPEAALVMAGEGPLYETVKAEKHPGVHLTGMLPYDESIALLAQADVFCLPTYSEGFSSVILEAAAVGCFIVTTKTGGSPELIGSGESGLLLEDIRAQTIADALLLALRDDVFRKSAGKAVQRTVQERFTWQKTAEKLAEIAKKEQIV